MHGFHESRSDALAKTSTDPPSAVVGNCEHERRDVPRRIRIHRNQFSAFGARIQKQTSEYYVCRRTSLKVSWSRSGVKPTSIQHPTRGRLRAGAYDSDRAFGYFRIVGHRYQCCGLLTDEGRVEARPQVRSYSSCRCWLLMASAIEQSAADASDPARNNVPVAQHPGCGHRRPATGTGTASLRKGFGTRMGNQDARRGCSVSIARAATDPSETPCDPCRRRGCVAAHLPPCSASRRRLGRGRRSVVAPR